MNKSMKTICRDIKQGTNLETNLPNYFNRLVTLYEEYATLNLTMNYYTYYESYIESTSVKSKEEKELIDEVNHVIRDYLLSGYSADKTEEGITKVANIRKNIMKHMQLLTAYTDIFIIFEYVFERMEYRFTPNDMDIDEEAFATEVFQYIFAGQDNMLINEKIKEVIGELPVRMTKNKYFDILKDSISVYKNGDRTSLDNFVYVLETAAMLYKPEGIDTHYQDLQQLKDEFMSLDYTGLTKDQFDIYVEKLKNVTLYITDKVDFYYGLQEVVNFLYTNLILAPYGYMEGGYKLESMSESMKYLILPIGKEENICRDIISEINLEFLGEGKDLISAEEKLSKLEGIQEKVWDEILMLEPTLDDISNGYEQKVEELSLQPIFDKLRITQNLIGNSLFIELDKEVVEGIVDEDYIKEVQDTLITKLTDLFSKCHRQVIRGIMAGTLNKMPVFFNTSEEILNYIKNALLQCTDVAEKISSIEIIKEICEL